MSYHQLRMIDIKGYKSIKNQSIPLKQLNVLIGQNGAGKTNLISLFRFLRNVIEQRLKNVSLKAGAENLLYYGSKETNEISISLNFSPNFYEINLEPTSNENLFINFERCGYLGSGYHIPHWNTITIAEEESELEQKAKTNNIAKYVYEVLKKWRVYHFHDTSESAGVKKYSSIANNKFLFEDASNLAAFLYTLKKAQQEYYERIVKTIQLVIPFSKTFN